MKVDKTSHENADQKIVRLLKKFNDDLTPAVGGEVFMCRNCNGSGGIHYTNADGVSDTIFGFADAAELIKFLTADQLTRIVMTVNWAQE